MNEIKDKYIYKMSSQNEPALTVCSDSEVVFITRDCFNNLITDEEHGVDSIDWNHINPATGPLYVEEAEPGDTLKVEIKEIKLADCGTMAAIPDAGVLGKDIEIAQVKRIPVKNRVAYFNESIQIPCTPMIGVIGVAPESEEIPCGEPGNHGGNMDNTRIGEGATLYFPVYTKGALLSMGDVHANMGDGEIMVTGIEIPADITVKVTVLKDKKVTTPHLETEDSYYIISSDSDLEQCIYDVTSKMTKFVMEKTGLSFNEAGMLLSAVGDLEICQVVDPKRTLRLKIAKKYLRKNI